MRQFRQASLKSQRGISLIEAMIVIGLSTWYMVSAAQLFQVWANYQIALIQGSKVAKYNSAVASYVSNEPARLSNLNPPQGFPFGAYNGIGWLQTPPCAGAAGAVMYLPCGFDPFSSVGLTFDTTVAQNGQFILATTILGPAVTGIGVDRALGGGIVNAARAYQGSYTANLESTYGFTRYDIDPDTGILFAYVDTAVLGTPYLKTNGSNQMTGNLNMGNNSVNNANAVNSATVNAANAVNANTVNATTDVNAGRNVTANTSGAGGNVQISGTNINLSNSVQSPVEVKDYGSVPKPTCPPDKPTPKIAVATTGFTTGPTAEPVAGITYNAWDQGTSWTVNIMMATKDYPTGVSAGPNVIATASTWCE